MTDMYNIMVAKVGLKLKGDFNKHLNVSMFLDKCGHSNGKYMVRLWSIKYKKDDIDNVVSS